jgi:hypothetical protein
VFKEFGVPLAIRTDNGVPFASPNALYGLSRLSAWWLRLGIAIERIKPGNPQRMHLTLHRLPGQKVGIKQVDDRLWLASFMSYDLGYFDEDTCRLEPIENPFAARVLPGGRQ